MNHLKTPKASGLILHSADNNTDNNRYLFSKCLF